jgi:hypothetical protein
MSKSAQTLKFRITNSQNFVSFLKKLKLVDKSVPLEIEDGNIFAKVKTSDKSVIKYVEIPLVDFMEGDLPKERLKIGILEIGKLMDVFKYFGPEEDLNLYIESQPYDGDLIATSIKFSSSSLNIFVKCADVTLLGYIDDKIQKAIHSTDGSELSFDVTQETFQKISSLTGIENNSEELLHFDFREDGVTVRGNSFQYQILKGKPAAGYTTSKVFTIYKNQFSYIDQEASDIHFHENRILFKSNESESIIAIGLVEV